MSITLHWPQVVLLILCLVEVIVVAVNHGKPRTEYSLGITILNTTIILCLLHTGGFFG